MNRYIKPIRIACLFLFLFSGISTISLAFPNGDINASQDSTRTISYNQFLDKVHGGWIGKAIGLVMGEPNEWFETWPPSDFSYYDELPTHFSDRYSGDDVYMPLLNQEILKKYGAKTTPNQIMAMWQTQLYSGKVWGSCVRALELSYLGVFPPQTGLPGYNNYWDDMCAHISTDNFGWSAPGLINSAVSMADYSSHVTNWGEAADAGVFTAAMCSEAFFTSDIRKLIAVSRSVLPEKSPFGIMVDELLVLSITEPDWRTVRQQMAKKYNKDLKQVDSYIIPATGIGTLIGLLYGNGDFGESMVIAQKCRWDSDCTAATVAGLIGTIVGYSGIDVRWTAPIHDLYENYCLKGFPRWMTFTDIAKETVEIGEKTIVENGGQVIGKEENKQFIIPIQKPFRLTRDERITEDIMNQNKKDLAVLYENRLKGLCEKAFPGWSLKQASFEARRSL